MPKEIQPIFDVESMRPRSTENDELELKRREKTELSQPIPPQSREHLEKHYPGGNFKKGFYIVENDRDKMVFDKDGREVEHSTYRRLNPDKPSEFDVQSRVTATYYTDGYLRTITRMEVGKYGFVKTYNYNEAEDGSRVLDHVVTQPVLRNGLMEPGPAIGQPSICDFSDLD